MAQTAIEMASACIQGLRRQGLDPRAYRRGLAERLRLPVEAIETLIAAADATAVTVVDPETMAQERLDEERRLARTQPAAYRAWQHEEE